MLQALREKTSGWIAVAIVAVLAVPFAFFGMEQYLFQGMASDVAKVEAPPRWWESAPDWGLARKLVWDNEEITSEDFRTAFENERSRRREEQGDRFDARAFENPIVKREVLETLIDRAVMRLTARQAGIVVGDAQVRQAIEAIEVFQVEGRFDPQRYQLLLLSQNPPLTPQMFQDQMRADLQQAVIPSQVARSAFIPEPQAQRMLALLEETRDVRLAVLPAPDANTADISDEEVAEWHQRHLHLYRAPESISLDYIEIDGSQLPLPAEPDEASLHQRYEQEKARFTEPEQRLASHLLIAVNGDDEAAQKAAEDKAAMLAKQARGGSDFAALAREHSDDTGSKASGGDLGWVERGMMAGPFEETLFAMQPGEISPPVKTDFGWHVLQLRDLKSGAEVPFEQVREELAAEEREAALERQFSDLSGQVVDEVYRNPTSLEAAATLAGQTVQRVGPVVRGEPTGFAALPEIQRAAFSESLIQDGTVSDPIELGPHHIALIRVVEHTPERALTLDEAREQIVLDIRHDHTTREAREYADTLLARLHNGEDLQTLADEARVKVDTGEGLSRRLAMQSGADIFFSIPAPHEDGPPAVGKLLLPDNSVLLFVVDKATPGDVNAISAEQQAMLRQELAGLYGNEDAQTLLQMRRREMKISVFEERL